MITAARKIIQNKPSLIWYIKDYKHLNAESIIEAVLNYGNFDDVKKLFAALGIKKVARVFRKQLGRSRNNYYPEIINYFRLYFKRHAQ